MWKTRVTNWLRWAACVILLAASGGIVGGLVAMPFSMVDAVHAVGIGVGLLIGLAVGIRFRRSLPMHRSCLLIGPLVMAAAFGLCIYGVMDAWDAPYAGLRVLVTAVFCGGLSLAGLLLALSGWVGTIGLSCHNRPQISAVASHHTAG